MIGSSANAYHSQQREANMFKKITAMCLAALLAALLASCGTAPNDGNEGKLTVIVSFNAMYEFASAVGQDKVSVRTMVPDGMEAHDFEPKAQDIAALSTATVFVYSGLGMEPWAEDAISSAANKNLIVVEASEGVEAIEISEEHRDETENDTETEAHAHGDYDPHTWLSLKAAQIEVENIKNALVKVDPEDAAFYEKNAVEYIAKLEALYETYAEKMNGLSEKNFVTGHAAFAYLCRDFGLVQTSVADVFAEGEPSARQLGELVEFCKANSIATIFAEALASPEVSKTLADEVGAQVKAIYTMENAEDGLTYLERMESNLKEIYESLVS